MLRTSVAVAALSICLHLRIVSVLVAFIAAAVVLLTPRLRNRDAAFAFAVLGFLTPLLSLAGAGTLLVCAALVLALIPIPLPSLRAPLGPFLALLLVWCTVELVLAISIGDFIPVRSVVLLRELFLQAPSQWLRSVEGCLRFVVLALILGLFWERSDLLHRFRSGLLYGVPAACGVGILQLILLKTSPDILALFPSQTSFWMGQGRLAASFTDPNAFGVFAALVLPVLWACTTRYARGSAMLLLFLALFSGSRTLLVVLAVYALARLLRKPRYLTAAVAALVLVALALNLTTLGSQLKQHEAPPSLVRAANLLTLSELEVSIFSRMAFWKAGLAMAQHHPLLGIGFERFRRDMVPYAAHIGLTTRHWSDNSNSFYLGILAELGILGLALFLVALLSLRWKAGAPAAEKLSLIALAVVLVFGPHTSFDEVAILTAYLLAQATQLRTSPIPARYLIPLCLFAFGRLFSLEGGTYSWEQQKGRLVRWTKKTAIVTQRCNEQGQGTLMVRALAPNVPLALSVTQPSGEIIRLRIDKPEALFSIPVQCELGERLGVFRIHADRGWIPSQHGSKDSRLLGVQLQYDDPGEVVEP